MSAGAGVSTAAPEPTTAVLVVARPIAQGDAARLSERLHALVRDSGAEVIVCDVRALEADAHSVDALARLQLTARRLGRRIRLVRATPELDDLLAFLGLADVVGCGPVPREGTSRPPPSAGSPPKQA